MKSSRDMCGSPVPPTAAQAIGVRAIALACAGVLRPLRMLPSSRQLNLQLIADEGHPNTQSVAQLRERMRAWLAADYRAVLFERGA